ncbi:MAG: hypothetical protein AB2689_29180 [Candidatus Thiodiazotropha taylori]
MKSYIPLISAIFFGLGFLVASIVKENEFGGIVEQSVVLESALETRLHTVLLTRLREGKVEESISTLENSLGIKEVLLETCSTPSCSVAMTREVIEAKKLIEDYRKAYPSSK